MRELIRQFIEICAETLPISDPIYEFGSLQVKGQEGFADLRPFFPGKQYFGADMREGLGVDVILNLHHIDLPSESVGTVLIMDTLEHVEFPYRALEEVYKIVRPNGIVIISSVMNFPIHDYPCDYWRFTPEAFRSLLKPFSDSFVGYAGESNFPHTVVGIGFKGAIPGLDQFRRSFEAWRTQQDTGLQSQPATLHQSAEDKNALIADLRRAAEEKDGLIADLSSQLLAIRVTIGWRILERFRQARNYVLPPGSRRWNAYLTFRRLAEVFLDERSRVLLRKIGHKIRQP